MSSLPFFSKIRESKSKLQDLRPSNPSLPRVLQWRNIPLNTFAAHFVCVAVCWSGGSPRCGRLHLHSIPPILLWPVGQGDPTQRRAPRKYLPRPLPWHRRRRPQVGAPPLFPRTSSTHSRTWWTNGRCRCQSHGSDWTQVCWWFGWWDTSSLGIQPALQQ